jgi:hypothetical protein
MRTQCGLFVLGSEPSSRSRTRDDCLSNARFQHGPFIYHYRTAAVAFHRSAMSLLVPFNNATHLGQGFNSFLSTLKENTLPGSCCLRWLNHHHHHLSRFGRSGRPDHLVVNPMCQQALRCCQEPQRLAPFSIKVGGFTAGGSGAYVK